MRKIAGFTLLEMMVSMALFASGSVYIYATFAGVTQSSKSATVNIDLGSQNKRGMTRLFSELQASSLTEQDTDGLDSTDPEAVLVIENDGNAPVPHTKAKIVKRVNGGPTTNPDGTINVGGGKEQARERTIAVSKRLRFRKVVGFQFNASAGTIVPQWSNWITFQLNDRNQLVRVAEGGATRTVANNVDAFDVDARPDGTLVVTMITARRDPNGAGWRRYANSVTIHPKN